VYLVYFQIVPNCGELMFVLLLIVVKVKLKSLIL